MYTHACAYVRTIHSMLRTGIYLFGDSGLNIAVAPLSVAALVGLKLTREVTDSGGGSHESTGSLGTWPGLHTRTRVWLV